MKLRTIIHHFKEAASSIRRNGHMSAVSVGIIALCLLILGGFILVIANLHHIAEDIESRVEIRVFLKDDLSERGIDQLGEELLALEEVKKVEFISKEQGLEQLKQELDEPKVFALVEKNPLPHSFKITLKEPQAVEAVASKVQKLEGIEEVNYGKEWVERLFTFTRALWIIGVLTIAALLTIVVLIITNTVRLAVFARRKEIEIMKLVGATNWFIRLPFLLEGMLMGLAAGCLATLFLYFGYSFVAAKVVALAPFLPWLPMGSVVTKVCFGVVALGMFVGATSSAFSIRKYLQV